MAVQRGFAAQTNTMTALKHWFWQISFSKSILSLWQKTLEPWISFFEWQTLHIMSNFLWMELVLACPYLSFQVLKCRYENIFLLTNETRHFSEKDVAEFAKDILCNLHRDSDLRWDGTQPSSCFSSLAENCQWIFTDAIKIWRLRWNMWCFACQWFIAVFVTFFSFRRLTQVNFIANSCAHSLCSCTAGGPCCEHSSHMETKEFGIYSCQYQPSQRLKVSTVLPKLPLV